MLSYDMKGDPDIVSCDGGLPEELLIKLAII